MKIRPIGMLPVLLLAAGSLLAETEYVTDKLRLGVHLTRDTSGRAFAFLNSGDAVEVLERDGRLTFVKMEDERTGWVRGSFLQPEAPALRRIAGVEAENKRLSGELEALKARDGGRQLEGLQAAAAEAGARADAAEDEVSRLQSENRDLRDELLSLRGGMPSWWLFVGIAGGLLFGAFVTWRWIDYRSRQRHGGFRIY